MAAKPMGPVKQCPRGHHRFRLADSMPDLRPAQRRKRLGGRQHRDPSGVVWPVGGRVRKPRTLPRPIRRKGIEAKRWSTTTQ